MIVRAALLRGLFASGVVLALPAALIVGQWIGSWRHGGPGTIYLHD